MKNKLSILLFLLAILLTLQLGCRPKKIIVAPPPAQHQSADLNDKKLENLNLLKTKNLDYQTLTLKGKANLVLNSNQNEVSMLIRIEKDKKIWVSVSAIAGIEVARALISPDSLKLLNRLEKTYLKKPFSYLHDFTNKQVNFSVLQSVLSGNIYDNFMVESSDLIQENGIWVLSGNAEDLAFRAVFNTLLKLSEVTLNDAKTAKALKVVYGSYTPVNGALFPSSLKMNTMSGQKKMDLSIEFSKIESNGPIDFPFNVPKSFEFIH